MRAWWSATCDTMERRRPSDLDDRAALKRWLLTLRAAGYIALLPVPVKSSQQQIFVEFSDYLRTERGLTAKTIERHLPTIRRFLVEVCPAGASDLGNIEREKVIRYVEHHAQDGISQSGTSAVRAQTGRRGRETPQDPPEHSTITLLQAALWRYQEPT